MAEALMRKRLTREESRAQTRERLLDSALAIFIRDGVEIAAIEEIAEEAGYSRGAFYSNFSTKDELLFALLEREKERAEEGIDAILSEALPKEELIHRLREYYINKGADPGHCILFLGVQLYSMRHPEIRPKVVEFLRNDREKVVEQVRKVYAALGQEPPCSAEILALGLMGIAQGLCLTQAIDPSFLPPELLPQVLGTMFDRIGGF